jgi:serine/threonine protein kinase, bacterial
VFVADTANCRVRVLPVHSGTILGHAVTAGQVATVAGTGVCGTSGQGGPAADAQLWSPVAVILDAHGDLLVADSGDQSVLLESTQGGTFYGTSVAAGHIGVVVGGTETYGPYLEDGQPATGIAAELNDPRAIAVGPTGALFVTDGFMRAIRVVPATPGPLLGRTMAAGDLYTAAGALPVKTASGLGNGTRWILTTMGTAVGIAVSPSGAVTYSDGTLDTVREIGG